MSRKVDTQLPTLAKLKIILVGDSGSGKTSILNKYLKPEGKMAPTTPTIGIDYQSKRCDIDNTPSYVHFWDLSGDDLYSDVRNEFYTETHAVILVLDMSNRDSLNRISFWHEEGNKFHADWSTAILMANKIDLTAQITKDEVNAAAKKIGIPVFFVSAKTGEGINEAFSAIMKQSLPKAS